MTIPLILSTGSLFNFNLDTIMRLAAEIGYDGIELMVDWRQETQDPVHLWQLVRKHRLPILAVHSPFTPMTASDWPANPVDSIKRSVQLAEILGAQTVIVHPPGKWVRFEGAINAPHKRWKVVVPAPISGPGPLGQWLTNELPAFQATTPVKIAVENMPARRWGTFRLNAHHFSSASELRQFPFVTLDTTHVGTRDWDLLDFYQQLAGRVAHIHLSNFNGHEHQLPDNGHLPLAALLQQLQQNRFDGLVSLELGPHSLQTDRKERVPDNLQRSLAFCRQALGHRPQTNGG